MHIRFVYKKTTAGGTTFETFESARTEGPTAETDGRDGRTDGRERSSSSRSLPELFRHPERAGESKESANVER